MKKILIAILASLVMVIGIASATTTVDTTWDGGGIMHTVFNSGDDYSATLDTTGTFFSGQFHATDYDDNPYSYGVDSSKSNVVASVTNGEIEYTANRLDSKSSYGAAGQTSYSYVGSSGTAAMAWTTKTNYASMDNCQYSQPTTTNGKNFEATGSVYMIQHQITDSSGDGANFLASGDGSAMIKLQGETSAGSAFNMGHLPVCGDGKAWCNNYATFAGTGSGDFNVNAWADNDLSVHNSGTPWTIPGDGSDDSAQFNLHVSYAGDWSMPDFGVKGN